MAIYIFRFRLQIYTFFSVIASFQDFFCCFEGCFRELFRHFRGKKQELFLFGVMRRLLVWPAYYPTQRHREFLCIQFRTVTCPTIHDLLNYFFRCRFWEDFPDFRCRFWEKSTCRCFAMFKRSIRTLWTRVFIGYPIVVKFLITLIL